MRDWKKSLIAPSTSIRDTVIAIEENALQIALVVNENNRLLGTVTDGDVRRGILKGISLDDPVEQIMSSYPTVASISESRETILEMMRQKTLHQIPIVDDDGYVVGLEVLDELLLPQERENWVVLMAGGLGSRLSPLTDDCPKPLLKIGSKPILEIILENFIEYGFGKFYLSVNYRAEMVEEYFGDGSRWGIEIRYLREKEKLGTAGALGLLPERPTEPFMVMNGDLLTKVNFKQLLDFHLECKAQATMCIREHDLQVPYGVVKIEKHRLVGIFEKPVQRFFVNAGIYVFDPLVLDIVPKNQYFDMPSLFEKFDESSLEAAVFPIREYWLDIGRMDDFERANGEYISHFDNE